MGAFRGFRLYCPLFHLDCDIPIQTTKLIIIFLIRNNFDISPPKKLNYALSWRNRMQKGNSVLDTKRVS